MTTAFCGIKQWNSVLVLRHTCRHLHTVHPATIDPLL